MGQNQTPPQEAPGRLESIVERALWSTRFMVVIAVAAGLLGSLALFILGAWDIWEAVQALLVGLWTQGHPESEVLGLIIGAVDVFLIAVVLLLFCFGLYELFISEIDEAKEHPGSEALKISSLDKLKDKIASVIIMALIVKFFQIILTLQVKDFWEILIFASSVALLALSVFLLQLGHRMVHTRDED